MEPYRAERPEQLYLDIGRWSVSVWSIAVTVVFVLVVGMLAKSVWTSNGRAEDWRRRAIANEELVGGLRVVIAQRSKALNERTVQANSLAATLDSSRGALRDTRSNVGSLTRRQRALETEVARTAAELRASRSRQAALTSVAADLNACAEGLETVVRTPKTKPVVKRSWLARSDQARASLRSYLQSVG